MAKLAFTVDASDVEAKIQSRLGTFLGLKARILRMRNETKNENTRATAQILYDAQLVAEEKVKKALVAADEIKTIGSSLSRISTIGVGTAAMEYQIQAVNDLERPFIREMGGSPRTDWFLFARTALLIGSGLFFFRRIILRR